MSIGSFIRSKIQSAITNELQKAAGRVADKARSNASWSSTIPDAISVGSVQNANDILFADVIVDLNKAPEAAAFEFGSGIHKKTDPDTYRIPKEGSGLAFFWDKVDETTKTGRKFRGILPDGRAGFIYVDHPGVEAKPYLQPAIESERKSFRGRLLGAFKRGYYESVPRVTIIEVKM